MFKGIFDFNQSFTLRYTIILPIIGLIIIGLIVLSSTSSDNLNNIYSTFYRQLLWLTFGVMVFVLVQYIRVQFLYDLSYIFYFLLMFLILLTLFSPIIEGSKRWIVFGPIYFQPSEFGKILYVLCISRFFIDNKKYQNLSMYTFFILFIILLPIFIIIGQPDLGTGMVYLSIILPLLYWSGLKLKYIFLLVAPLISILATYNIIIFYLWMLIFFIVILFSRYKFHLVIINFIINVAFGIISPFIWNELLKPHQKRRIETFLDPLSDPLGSGYQLLQSIISIGSGGLLGKGWGKGTQTHLKFLPVRDTDFIISVIGEELGFLFIFFILSLLIMFIYWCFIYAQKVDNRYASCLIIGFSSIIFMHMIINMSVISGLLPVTGLPAPFISYGGSFLLTCFIILGLINNIINNYI